MVNLPRLEFDKRKAHVKRLFAVTQSSNGEEEDRSQWIDMYRIDQFTYVDEKGIKFGVYLLWEDEPTDPIQTTKESEANLAFYGREISTKRLTDPQANLEIGEEPDFWFNIPIIDLIVLEDRTLLTKNAPEDRKLRFINDNHELINLLGGPEIPEGFNVGRRKLWIRRVTHWDTEYPEGENVYVPALEYERKGGEDTGQYVDQEIPQIIHIEDNTTPNNKRFTVAMFNFDMAKNFRNKTIDEIKEERQAKLPPIRLDPFQQIVNCNFGTVFFALAGYLTVSPRQDTTFPDPYYPEFSPVEEFNGYVPAVYNTRWATLNTSGRELNSGNINEAGNGFQYLESGHYIDPENSNNTTAPIYHYVGTSEVIKTTAIALGTKSDGRIAVGSETGQASTPDSVSTSSIGPLLHVFSKDGTKLWDAWPPETSLNAFGNENYDDNVAFITGLSFDSENNLIAIGGVVFSYDENSDPEIGFTGHPRIRKYSKTGSIIWEKGITEFPPTALNEAAYLIAVGLEDKIAVVVDKFQSPIRIEIYDKDGSSLRTLSVPLRFISNIVWDKKNNLFVTGYTEDFEFKLLRFSSGQTLINTINLSYFPNDMDISSSGNIYISGSGTVASYEASTSVDGDPSDTNNLRWIKESEDFGQLVVAVSDSNIINVAVSNFIVLNGSDGSTKQTKPTGFSDDYVMLATRNFQV